MAPSARDQLRRWTALQLVKLSGEDEDDVDYLTDTAEYVNVLLEGVELSTVFPHALPLSVRYLLATKDAEEVRAYVTDFAPEASGSQISSFVNTFQAKKTKLQQPTVSTAPAPTATSTVVPASAPAPAPAAAASPITLPPPGLTSASKTSKISTTSKASKVSTASTANKRREQLPVDKPVGDTLAVQASLPPLYNPKRSTATKDANPGAGAKTNAGVRRPRPKFVSFMNRDGDSLVNDLLPGRRFCECLASRHQLINNCLRCGRIVCEQEGIGPCMHCGACVVTREQQELLARDSKQARKFLEKLMREADVPATVSDQLLDYDRNMAQRTRVIDDQADYFNTDGNKWQSRQERDAARQREAEMRDERRAARRENRITIDFAGRQVRQADVEEVDIYAEAHREEEERRERALHKTHRDRELQEMADGGFCMSMHQPWASLLVYGIKMHEGRVWTGPHRGRLWIAAASKQPDPEEIQQLEDFYRERFAGRNVPFPKEYPTACLLGFVDVEDILPQDEYRQKFPDGDSHMPYVFVCKNPHELIVRYPVKGQHKIWKLDKTMHDSARQCIQPVDMSWLEEEPI
ncbi:uncharacterized protein MONBRDRAFT_35853 [Monosiga brevicollis MX1]|uniref:ASCH domain-containing protein n=1 Tax=Monosiga brevicollis TaxID=81824 RepID=A9US72_MONBE|nr:uncharacterized protein MONBRDRAFT_35853 [Monosiga brevicollis MX1]EDQ91729.1 predicted protein [Monosiga brevicollis MX1]|eukprot:XP_001743015.1 hypothetical protein [Monosiga brevicollis MX1]